MEPFLIKNIVRMSPPFKLVIIILALCLFGMAFFFSLLGPTNSADQLDRLFIVKKGATATQIAQDLEKEGLIKNARAFLVYAKLTGNLGKLKAGHYFFNTAMNIQEMVNGLVEGKAITLTFTIPEGYTLTQIAEVLAKKEIMTEKEFWAVTKENDFAFSFLQELPPHEKRLEGYLFPDTYTIDLDTPAEEVIKMMLRQFEKVYQNLPPNRTNLSTHEVVTLASIIEGECLLDRERPLVASVFFNRLKIGQKLEADATVQYCLDERKQRVLFTDTEIESAYNTYKIIGLPPGPIGCPGKASLQAVLEPANTDSLYFVAKKDNSGEHVFAKTFAEHKKNKRELGY